MNVTTIHRIPAVLLASLLACGDSGPVAPYGAPGPAGAALADTSADDETVNDRTIEACLARRPEGSLKADVACPLDHFYRIDDKHYRGARPDAAGLAVLARLGVRTILNMEDYTSSTRRSIERERKAAQDLGITMHSLPVSPILPLDRDYIGNIISLIGVTEHQPVYLHCLFGTERTGFIMGLDRVFNQGWCPNDAYAEMVRYGFRGWLVPALRHDFFVWTKGRCENL